MTLDGNRVRGVFAMRGIKLSAASRRLGVSDSYVSQQIGGLRPITGETLSVLREMLGSDAWAWCTRETDVLK